jgi:hypothetical protein
VLCSLLLELETFIPLRTVGADWRTNRRDMRFLSQLFPES